MVFKEIPGVLTYLLKISVFSEAFWVVLPLAIATIVMVIYFQKYKTELSGWNNYVASSLILLFVSLALFRQIYLSDIYGAVNFIEYSNKSIVVVMLLLIGLLIVRFNFFHALPKKIVEVISSGITLNILAYVATLYVYAELEDTFALWISLIILFAFWLAVFNLLKIPLRILFKKLEKMKEKERVEDIKQEQFEISELKGELKKKEKKLKKDELGDVDKQKKQAIKFKRLINFGKINSVKTQKLKSKKSKSQKLKSRK